MGGERSSINVRKYHILLESPKVTLEKDAKRGWERVIRKVKDVTSDFYFLGEGVVVENRVNKAGRKQWVMKGNKFAELRAPLLTKNEGFATGTRTWKDQNDTPIEVKVSLLTPGKSRRLEKSA